MLRFRRGATPRRGPSRLFFSRLCPGLVLLLGLAFSGCGERPVILEGTAEDGGRELTAMLAAWQSGEKPDAYSKSKKPEIVVGDEDWTAGAVLKSFELEAPVKNGGNWRVPAKLVVFTPERGERTRSVAYAVTLKPTVSIVRADDTEF